MTEDSKAELEEILGDSDLAEKVFEGLKSSMGREMSELDTVTYPLARLEANRLLYRLNWLISATKC